MKLMMKQDHIQRLIDEGFALIDAKYGKDSPNYLAYHNTEHARDVMGAAVQLGHVAFANGKIAEEDIALLELAACYHDVEHGLHGSENELESIAILVGKMHKINAFTETDIEKITAMITATIVQIEGASIKQSATEDYLTQIMADADLCAFGKPFDVFWDRSKKLLFENTKKVFEALNMQQKIKYIDKQICILQTHTYYTEEATRLLPNSRKNEEKLKGLRLQYGK